MEKKEVFSMDEADTFLLQTLFVRHANLLDKSIPELALCVSWDGLQHAKKIEKSDNPYVEEFKRLNKKFIEDLHKLGDKLWEEQGSPVYDGEYLDFFY